MKSAVVVAISALASALSPSPAGAPTPHEDRMEAAHVRYRTVNVGGVEIFYREAGRAGAPVVLLMHGFPSSSFMYRQIIGPLARNYRVIAPDYPGFGQSAFPSRSAYSYTFENLANTMLKFVEAVGADSYALYVQDYGAPIGFRMALKNPERVAALIVQNGNAYEEGLSSGWDPLRAYWREPTPKNRQALRGWLTRDGIRDQYLAGVPPQLHERFAPEAWTLDWSLLQRPGSIDVQLDLFGDYRHNVELYPAIQRMFREHSFPTLIVWGKYDPFFTAAGANAYQRDLPEVELHWLDTGHFALETHHTQVVTLIRDFLARRLPN
jgi:pimeloyl-ACP methyl ester carboxylesterase